MVDPRRKNGAISGVGHKRPPLIADEGPVINLAAALIVDGNPIRASVLMHENECNRLFQTLVLRCRRQGHVLEKQEQCISRVTKEAWQELQINPAR